MSAEDETLKKYDDLDLAIMGVERVLGEFRHVQEHGHLTADGEDLGAEHLALHMSFFLGNAHKRLLRLREKQQEKSDA
jgi:hypothetical protein